MCLLPMLTYLIFTYLIFTCNLVSGAKLSGVC